MILAIGNMAREPNKFPLKRRPRNWKRKFSRKDFSSSCNVHHYALSSMSHSLCLFVFVSFLTTSRVSFYRGLNPYRLFPLLGKTLLELEIIASEGPSGAVRNDEDLTQLRAGPDSISRREGDTTLYLRSMPALLAVATPPPFRSRSTPEEVRNEGVWVRERRGPTLLDGVLPEIWRWNEEWVNRTVRVGRKKRRVGRDCSCSAGWEGNLQENVTGLRNGFLKGKGGPVLDWIEWESRYVARAHRQVQGYYSQQTFWKKFLEWSSQAAPFWSGFFSREEEDPHVDRREKKSLGMIQTLLGVTSGSRFFPSSDTVIQRRSDAYELAAYWLQAVSALKIPFFADGGTAMAAVRNRGFTSFDYDFDVGLAEAVPLWTILDRVRSKNRNSTNNSKNSSPAQRRHTMDEDFQDTAEEVTTSLPKLKLVLGELLAQGDHDPNEIRRDWWLELEVVRPSLTNKQTDARLKIKATRTDALNKMPDIPQCAEIAKDIDRSKTAAGVPPVGNKIPPCRRLDVRRKLPQKRQRTLWRKAVAVGITIPPQCFVYQFQFRNAWSYRKSGSYGVSVGEAAHWPVVEGLIYFQRWNVSSQSAYWQDYFFAEPLGPESSEEIGGLRQPVV